MINVNFNNTVGEIKRMNAVNNGPLPHGRATQDTNNFFDYKKANIPFARNHDASFCNAFGLDHTVDVAFIFRNFDADENDAENYDFTLTDNYIETTFEAGTETFYRLGSRIEHWAKKYNTLPPKDFLKWAKICEHIILHMNYGWGEGKHYNLKYWEIWNEPDLDVSCNPLCWGGTKEQFFDFYEVVAKYLKSKFPELKIGGPAVAFNLEWTEDFIKEMSKRGVPIDFFSWHRYAHTVEEIENRTRIIRKLLDENGYKNTESINDEWNYCTNFEEGMDYTIEHINDEKGASFTQAVMSKCQNLPIDMLMYYDARPTSMNGLFDFYYMRKKKGYYPFYVWGQFLKLKNQAEVEIINENCIYATAAVGNNKGGVAVTYFTDDDECEENKEVEINLKGIKTEIVKVYVVDKNRDYEKLFEFSGDKLKIELKPQTILYLDVNSAFEE